MKKTTAIMLSLAMVLCVVCVAQSADQDDVSADSSASITSWSDLQEAIDDARRGSTIKLTQSLKATSADSCLVVASGTTFTLDLNGYSLDRGLNLNAHDPNGSVIFVENNAYLTLKNFGTRTSYISGGSAVNGGGIHNEGDVTMGRSIFLQKNHAIMGGGIYNTGTFTLDGGVIRGNDSDTRGGGIYNSGTLIINSGAVSENECLEAQGEGGGIFNLGGSLTIYNGTISNNTVRSCGGGIANKGQMSIANAAISGNRAKYGGGIYDASGYADNGRTSSKENVVSGCVITKNNADYGGGIFAGYNSERYDWKSSYKSVLRIEGGEISRNDAINGAGVFVQRTGTFILDGAAISDNQTAASSNSESGNGGGIYVNGRAVIEDGTIESNTAYLNGGGICLEGKYGNLEMKGGSVSGNTAKNRGGGVYAITTYGAVFGVQGGPSVQNNTASGKTENVYFPNGSYMTITGALTDAQIGVTVQKGIGVFTTGYSQPSDKYVQTWTDSQGGVQKCVEKVGLPAQYFISDAGYGVSLSYIASMYAEAAIQKVSGRNVAAVEYFVPDEYRLDVDVTDLNGSNWMSGVSGDRRINEINIPRTHDSGCTRVDGTGFINDDFERYAKTQYLYIDQQLQAGIRGLDLRLNNWHPVGEKFLGFSVKWRDDGHNLYICHGKSAFGIMYAENRDGSDLTLDQILTWVKEFLTENPSETIIINLQPELNDKIGHNKISRDEPKVWYRVKQAIYGLYNEINPSTGEPFLYTEPGSNSIYSRYTHYPTLAECRGKILIECEETSVGGFNKKELGKVYSEDENKVSASKKVNLVEKFYSTYTAMLPTDVNDHFDYLYTVGTTTSGPDSNYISGNHRPVDFAKTVHEDLFGPGNVFDDDGRYYGWVRLDAADRATAKDIWDSNFFDEQYCTVTVWPGLIYPEKGAQINKVFRGAQFTVPNCIFSFDVGEVGMDFAGWKVESASGTAYYLPGQTISITEDTVVTAQWIYDSTTLTVVWQDGDNGDGLRGEYVPFLLTTIINGKTEVYYIAVRESEGWTATITDYVEYILPANWNGPMIRSYGNPPTTGGNDVAGQYRYETTGNQRDGYVVTLYHTPIKQITIAGTVTWEDGSDLARLRPYSLNLHLFRNGVEIASKTVSASDGWSYNFGIHRLYENGLKLDFALTADESYGYATFVDRYSVTNILVSAMEGTSMIGSILWAGDYGDHPESAKVRLLANGAEINSVDVTEDEDGIWGFGFYDLPENDADGNKIAYSLTADPVEGYHIVTFDRNGTGAIAFMYVLNSRFAEKPADPIPKEGETFAGWYAVNGNGSYYPFDFETRVTKDIVLTALFYDEGGSITSIRELSIDGSMVMEYGDDTESIDALLTQEEKDSNYGIYIVSSSGDGMSQSDKNALLALAEKIGATPVEFFQTSLYKSRDIWWGNPLEKLGTGAAEKLNKISSLIRMAVDIPQIMEKHGRTYYLLQCYEGKAEVVAQGNNPELMWESDKFSGYMLAYTDSPKSTDSNLALYVAISAIVILSLILIGTFFRKKP